MKILTPAKITPLLYILRKRNDGFHELFMNMVPVSLFDTLKFSHNNEDELNFRINGATFYGDLEDNLVVKAINLFQRVTGKKANFDVFLDKHIPSGAGLGGGSSNAAGTLRALNYIFRETPESEGLLSSKMLFEIALELGSDVPFFLNPSPCEILGRGERIFPLKEYPKFFVIIIKPTLSISTSLAYKKCKPKEYITFPKVRTFYDLKHHMKNQFEITLLPDYPVLSKMKTLLLENGAFGALVSGSGSAVFGVFKEKEMQNQALKKLACLHIGKIYSCETLAEHYYY